MEYRTTLLLICFVCMTAGASATAQDDANLIGIYFDDQGTINTVQVPNGQGATAYLAITNAEASSIAGWECSVVFENGMITDTEYSGNHINIDTPPNYVVGLQSPIPTADVTVLASLNMLFFGETYMAVDGAPDTVAPDGLPQYVDGDDFNNVIVCYNTTGYNNDGVPNPCAGVNKVFGSTVQTWSGIKSLYQ